MVFKFDSLDIHLPKYELIRIRKKISCQVFTDWLINEVIITLTSFLKLYLLTFTKILIINKQKFPIQYSFTIYIIYRYYKNPNYNNIQFIIQCEKCLFEIKFKLLINVRIPIKKKAYVTVRKSNYEVVTKCTQKFLSSSLKDKPHTATQKIEPETSRTKGNDLTAASHGALFGIINAKYW